MVIIVSLVWIMALMIRYAESGNSDHAGDDCGVGSNDGRDNGVSEL